MPTAKAKPLSASAKAAKTCRYGCTDPITCASPHRDCHHCKLARSKAGVPTKGNPAEFMDQNYTARHPIG